jgi:hypothetical protein
MEGLIIEPIYQLAPVAKSGPPAALGTYTGLYPGALSPIPLLVTLVLGQQARPRANSSWPVSDQLPKGCGFVISGATTSLR